MKQQTAVEFFIDLFKDEPIFLEEFALDISQAKKMEKQQIICAFENGQYNAHPDSCCKLINGETYYKQEFTL